MPRSRRKHKKRSRTNSTEATTTVPPSSHVEYARFLNFVSQALHTVLAMLLSLVVAIIFYLPAIKSPEIAEVHSRVKQLYQVLCASVYLAMIILILARWKHVKSRDYERQGHLANIITLGSYLMILVAILPSLYVAGVHHLVFRLLDIYVPSLGGKLVSLGSSLVTFVVSVVCSGIAWDLLK